MSLMYTEEQKALIALVKEMAENEIKPYVKDADIQFFLPPTVPGFGNGTSYAGGSGRVRRSWFKL